MNESVGADFQTLRSFQSSRGGRLAFVAQSSDGSRHWLRESGAEQNDVLAPAVPSHSSPAALPLRAKFSRQDGGQCSVFPYVIGIPLTLLLEEARRRGGWDGAHLRQWMKGHLDEKDRDLGDMRFWSQSAESLVKDLARQLLRILQSGAVCTRVSEEDFLITPFGRLLVFEGSGQATSHEDALLGGGVLLSDWIVLLGPNVSEAFRKIAYAANPKYPQDRYESLAAIERDFTRLEEGQPVFARQPGAALRAWRELRKDSRKVAALFLVAIVSAIALFAALTPRIEEKNQQKNSPVIAPPPATVPHTKPVSQAKSRETSSRSALFLRAAGPASSPSPR